MIYENFNTPHECQNCPIGREEANQIISNRWTMRASQSIGFPTEFVIPEFFHNLKIIDDPHARHIFTINPSVFTNSSCGTYQLATSHQPISTPHPSTFPKDAFALASNVSFGDKDLDQYQVAVGPLGSLG